MTHPHRICRLADEAAATEDPEAALRKLRELNQELVEFERSRVADALRGGSSFTAVAKALGISRQAAHRRYRDLLPAAGEPLPLSSHARRAILLAREEAAATGARGVGSQHLLLGVLRSGGGTSSALEAGGITAEATRRCLRAANGAAVDDEGVARTVMARAAEIARAQRARYVDADHIAVAALNVPGAARRAITALGISPAALRARLGC